MAPMETNGPAGGGQGAQGRALQLVRLNMEERRVDVNEEALAELEANMSSIQAKRVAIISVMGAFRTGKSFLLDFFLRRLRFEKAHGEQPPPGPVQRGGNAQYDYPDWVTSAGASLEGGNADQEGGFRFKGGMDHCTEGIWVWSEAFVRNIDGEPVALLLMDTQGAWDGNMTKEQSATVFGLTALLSSKQIYNINMQIQEDKVQNLEYFMRFAQAALRKEAQATSGGRQEDIDQPFQSLDFLVRDWGNFEDDWTMAQCRDQMSEHLDRHLNPDKIVENSTAEALRSMFARVGCFCLPHPGLKLQKQAWSGQVADIDDDFIRFLDEYVYEVFTEGLQAKTVLGNPLSPVTFPHVFRSFVKAFQDCAPAAMSLGEAMKCATVLLAKEQAMKSYVKKMDECVARNPRGMEPAAFEEKHRSFSADVEREFTEDVTILGAEKTRDDTWQSIVEHLGTLHRRYEEENTHRLEKALVAFANIALLALVLFVLDRASDYTCDWWSSTCRELSKVMFAAYMGITAYVGYHVYGLVGRRGRLAAAGAGAELWKEMMRLTTVYWELGKQMQIQDAKILIVSAFGGLQRLGGHASSVRELVLKQAGKAGKADTKKHR